MANTAVTTIVQQMRRYLRDWPSWDVITVAISSTSATTIKVVDTTRYYVNETLEIDQENMIVRAIADGTTLTVSRGAYGSTAATHLINTEILMKPAWVFQQYVDAINSAIQAAYPWVYQEVMVSSITILADTWEYAVPNMPGTYGGDTIFIPRIRDIDILDPGATGVTYVPMSGWGLRRDITAPKIKLNYLENPGATLRVRGYGPFPDVTAAGNLHAAWPRNLSMALTEYGASCLLMSGEAGRLRADATLLDNREAAQKPGASLNAANVAEARWQRRLMNAGLPPIQGRMVIQR